MEAIRDRLPAYQTVDEPYYLLEQEGYECAEMPSLEDFERQLERSLECVAAASGDTIFDRCPTDLLAYLITHPDSAGFDLEHWLPRVQRAMERIDLVVYVPIEKPDRLRSTDAEDDRVRRRVDAELRDMLLDDRYGFAMEVLEVRGGLDERLHQVLLRVSSGRGFGA